MATILELFRKFFRLPICRAYTRGNKTDGGAVPRPYNRGGGFRNFIHGMYRMGGAPQAPGWGVAQDPETGAGAEGGPGRPQRTAVLISPVGGPPFLLIKRGMPRTWTRGRTRLPDYPSGGGPEALPESSRA